MIVKSLAVAAALAAAPAHAEQYWAVGLTQHTMSFIDLHAIDETALGEKSFIVYQVYDADHSREINLLGNQSEVVVNCKEGTLDQQRMTLVTTSGKLRPPWDPKIPTSVPQPGSMGAAWVRMACTGRAPASIRKLGGPWSSFDEARLSYLARSGH